MDTGATLRSGRYVVRGRLGEGAQGVTYEATDTKTGGVVAIKRFNVGGAESWKEVELAEREARVLATLDHPLLPRYVEHFEDDGALFLVMEKVEGETLDAIRRREGALPEAEVRRFLACADRALTYLHGRGSPIVHRDIKPKNVVRRPDGSYVLVDFGAVREVLARSAASTIVGTMGYMAPEQFQGRALPASDVYAVGATALAALSGVEPETLPHKGLRTDARGALAGRASPEIVAAIESMMEPDPDLRPTSLSAVLDGMNVRSTGVPPVAPRPAEVRREVPAALVAVGSSKEDALVKSFRGLLWTLWGLGWVIVPVTCGQFGGEGAIPIIMFGSLAPLFIVTWHKGAVIRALLRRLGIAQPAFAPLVEQSASAPTAPLVEPSAPAQGALRAPPPQRAGLRVPTPPRLTVRADDLEHEDGFSETEVSTRPEGTARRQR
jgi:hypothetical protein